MKSLPLTEIFTFACIDEVKFLRAGVEEPATLEQMASGGLIELNLYAMGEKIAAASIVSETEVKAFSVIPSMANILYLYNNFANDKGKEGWTPRTDEMLYSIENMCSGDEFERLSFRLLLLSDVETLVEGLPAHLQTYRASGLKL